MFRPASIPPLPPRELADELLRRFETSVLRVFPILDWRGFLDTYDYVCQLRTLDDAAPDWSALLFAVFACGSVFNGQRFDVGIQEGKVFLESAQSLIDPWEEQPNLNHVLFALLSSIFLVEANMKSAAWLRLGSAIRMAQSIGLHLEQIPFEVDAEARQVWWSLYVWDR